MLNNDQIKLVQTAVRAAGLRNKYCEGRYRLLLKQYKQPDGSDVTSCKQLTNEQLDDLLAICESYGWQMPGKEADFYRKKIDQAGNLASYAQRRAIEYLAGDLGWNIHQVNGFVERQTAGKVTTVAGLSSKRAWGVIEGLKAILSRKTGQNYKNLTEVQSDMEVKNAQSQII